MIQAIQAASMPMPRKLGQPNAVTARMSGVSHGMQGHDQLVFAGSGRAPRIVAAALLTLSVAWLSSMPWGQNGPGGKAQTMGAPAPLPPPTVIPDNPTVTAKAGLGRTVPVSLQALEGQMVHYQLPGPKGDTEGFNTAVFKDKAGQVPLVGSRRV